MFEFVGGNDETPTKLIGFSPIEAEDDTGAKCIFGLCGEERNLSKVMKYNPTTRESTFIKLEFEDPRYVHYRCETCFGAAVASDGNIYLLMDGKDEDAPKKFKERLFLSKMNPKTQKAEVVVGNIEKEGIYYSFGAVSNKDGSAIFFTPCQSGKTILKFDVETKTISQIKVDAYADDTSHIGSKWISSKWFGDGVIVDGNIYFSPLKASQILQFNIATEKTQLVGEEYDGDWKWIGATTQNGKDVFFIPGAGHTHLLKLSTETMETKLVGQSLGDEARGKFSGAVQLQDQKIYMLSFNGDAFVCYNPMNDKITRIDLSPRLSKLEQITSTILTSNGMIFCAPKGASQFLQWNDTVIAVDSISDTPQSTLEQPESLVTLGHPRKSKFIGQCHLISAVKSLLREEDEIDSFTGITHPRMLMFNGPPGCGKTELACLIAEIIHGKVNTQLEGEGKFKSFSMGQFNSKENANTFFGAAPGYAGGDGQLVGILNKCPNAVIVLDEIEKAHEDVRNDAILSIYNGTIHSNGENAVSISTKQAIFIFTSNIKIEADDERKHIKKNGKVDIKKVSTFTEIFSDPMISRLKNKVLQFQESSEKDKEHFVRMILTRIRDGYKNSDKGHVELTWDYFVIYKLAKGNGTSGKTDNRNLKDQTNDSVKNLFLNNESFNRFRESGGVKVHLFVSEGKVSAEITASERGGITSFSQPKQKNNDDSATTTGCSHTSSDAVDDQQISQEEQASNNNGGMSSALRPAPLPEEENEEEEERIQEPEQESESRDERQSKLQKIASTTKYLLWVSLGFSILMVTLALFEVIPMAFALNVTAIFVIVLFIGLIAVYGVLPVLESLLTTLCCGTRIGKKCSIILLVIILTLLFFLMIKSILSSKNPKSGQVYIAIAVVIIIVMIFIVVQPIILNYIETGSWERAEDDIASGNDVGNEGTSDLQQPLLEQV